VTDIPVGVLKLKGMGGPEKVSVVVSEGGEDARPEGGSVNEQSLAVKWV
jgi:hypothetical protein